MYKKSSLKYLSVLFFLILSLFANAQNDKIINDSVKAINAKEFYGIASYYSDKFNGRKTANGEIFSQDKLTAACNKLPMGTRIKVTNLKNGQSVIVRVNDRLHPKMKRIVDLTKAAARKINIITLGIARVKVEVLKKRGK